MKPAKNSSPRPLTSDRQDSAVIGDLELAARVVKDAVGQPGVLSHVAVRRRHRRDVHVARAATRCALVDPCLVQSLGEHGTLVVLVSYLCGVSK